MSERDGQSGSDQNQPQDDQRFSKVMHRDNTRYVIFPEPCRRYRSFSL